MYANGKTNIVFYTTEKYDITGKKELIFTVTDMYYTNSASNGVWHFGIGNVQTDTNFVAEVSVNTKVDATKTEYKVQLPPDGGLYYIKIACIRSSYYADSALVSEIKMV